MTKTKKTKKNQPRPLPCTDTGNMERFIRDHRSVIKSGGHDRQWYVWTGRRWKPSPRDAAFNFALETIENIGLEAARSSTPSEAEELRKWHKTSQSEAKMNAMIKMAAQHEAISVSAGAFDSDRMILNCANGLVDLRTGKLLERGPEHLVSKLVDVDYHLLPSARPLTNSSTTSSAATGTSSGGSNVPWATPLPALSMSSFCSSPTGQVRMESRHCSS